MKAPRDADHLPLDAFTARGMALAAASGFAAAMSVLASPWGEGIPPLVFWPWIPVDLRFVGLPLLFLLFHAAVGRARWPRPALLLPTLSLLVAGAVHFTGSAFLGFITNIPGSDAGDRVHLLSAFLSGSSLLLALAAAMDRGRERLVAHARASLVPEERVAAITALADEHLQRTLGFASAAFIALLLVARLGDTALGGARAPLPEVLGALLAVAVAIALFPGVWRRGDAPPAPEPPA